MNRGELNIWEGEQRCSETKKNSK